MTSTSNQKREERAQDRAIDRAIDETKDDTRKVIQQVKREIPEFTAAFHDYQEENINTIKQMANELLDSQKEVAKSLRSAASSGVTPNIMPQYGFWAYPYWGFSQDAVEAYARTVNQVAETSIAATRLSNEILLSGMESSRASLRHAQSNSRAFSKYMIETANDLSRMANTESQNKR